MEGLHRKMERKWTCLVAQIQHLLCGLRQTLSHSEIQILEKRQHLILLDLAHKIVMRHQAREWLEKSCYKA